MEFIIGTVLSDALPKMNVGGVFLSTCSSSDGTGNARIRLISERMHGYPRIHALGLVLLRVERAAARCAPRSNSRDAR